MTLLQKRFNGEANRCLGIVTGCYDADLHGYLVMTLTLPRRKEPVKTPASNTSRGGDSNPSGCHKAIDGAGESACYSGTLIGAEPCAAFSALRIHTSPPKAPTINDTAPYSSDTFTPSFGISPA